MARLNAKEKLICKAATGLDPFLYLVYEKFYTYFEAETSTGKKIYDDCAYINYLYRQNHKGKTFESIARDSFHISPSTLEDRRATYVHIFNFYLTREKAAKEAAATKEL